jgi:prepilin-type N-terminal cleavage/methylation domain-containing protein
MRVVPTRTPRAGFTLVEILIVVVILGILAAIVVPKFAKASDEPVYQVAKNFEHLLELGVHQATIHGCYGPAPGETPQTFSDFVNAGGDKAVAETFGDTVLIKSSMRRLFSNPSAQVVDDHVLTLEFKTGLVAEYTLLNGKITATYTGPGAP